MSEEWVIILIVKNMQMEVIGARDIDVVVKMEETIRVNWPTRDRWFGDRQVDKSQRIEGKSGEDISIELLDIEEGGYSENWSSEKGSL